MTLMTETLARKAAERRVAAARKSAAELLLESARKSQARFDVFLSHSFADAETVLGVVAHLEALGHVVYVDWVVDRELDRSRVSPSTAAQLRKRMDQCDTLLYLHSEHSPHSKWMPWELGYFDAANGNVAILPVVRGDATQGFKGQEYLGIYPYVDFTGLGASSSGLLFIHQDPRRYELFDVWRRSADKLRPK